MLDPLISNVLIENERVFDEVQMNEFDPENPAEVQTYKEWDSDYLGAEEYAVYGWAKWSDDKPLQNGLRTLFRLALNDKTELQVPLDSRGGGRLWKKGGEKVGET